MADDIIKNPFPVCLGRFGSSQKWENVVSEFQPVFRAIGAASNT